MAKKKVQDQGEELNMDMSPMIDMVFLLLIFFIVVSTQAEVPIDPNVKPTIAHNSIPQKEALRRIVINVYPGDDGSVRYTNEDTQPIEKEDLQTYIADEKKRQAGSSDLPCTLHMRCDRRLPWKDIQVIQKAAAAAGIIEFNFASFQQNP